MVEKIIKDKYVELEKKNEIISELKETEIPFRELGIFLVLFGTLATGVSIGSGRSLALDLAIFVVGILCWYFGASGKIRMNNMTLEELKELKSKKDKDNKERGEADKNRYVNYKKNRGPYLAVLALLTMAMFITPNLASEQWDKEKFDLGITYEKLKNEYLTGYVKYDKYPYKTDMESDYYVYLMFNVKEVEEVKAIHETPTIVPTLKVDSMTIKLDDITVRPTSITQSLSESYYVGLVLYICTYIIFILWVVMLMGAINWEFYYREGK